MLLNRNDLLVGGLKPHNYCLPILKARMPGPPTGFDLYSDRCWRRMACSRTASFATTARGDIAVLPFASQAEEHRRALVAAATSGSTRWFCGTDSAPHLRSAKEAASCCAGCFTADASTELYAEVFEMAGACDARNCRELSAPAPRSGMSDAKAATVAYCSCMSSVRCCVSICCIAIRRLRAPLVLCRATG